MDILITIPKSEYKNDDLETQDMIENNLVQFWTLSKRPKNLEVGNRVYFLKHNRIESSMRVIEIKRDSTMQCETTQRNWTGSCIIVMDDLRTENFTYHVKGFQGFRYLEPFLANLRELDGEPVEIENNNSFI